MTSMASPKRSSSESSAECVPFVRNGSSAAKSQGSNEPQYFLKPAEMYDFYISAEPPFFRCRSRRCYARASPRILRLRAGKFYTPLRLNRPLLSSPGTTPSSCLPTSGLADSSPGGPLARHAAKGSYTSGQDPPKSKAG